MPHKILSAVLKCVHVVSTAVSATLDVAALCLFSHVFTTMPPGSQDEDTGTRLVAGGNVHLPEGCQLDSRLSITVSLSFLQAASSGTLHVTAS